MKFLATLLTLTVAVGLVVPNGNDKPIKRTTATIMEATALKLAEAKAVLSKYNKKNTKILLGTADGGI